MHIHVHESSGEVSDWKAAQGGETPIGTMDRLGMLKEGLVAVHMTQLTPAELDRIAASKVPHPAPLPRLLSSGPPLLPSPRVRSGALFRGVPSRRPRARPAKAGACGGPRRGGVACRRAWRTARSPT